MICGTVTTSAKLREDKMDGYTYIEILVEDDSGGILAKQIMDKYVADKDNII